MGYRQVDRIAVALLMVMACPALGQWVEAKHAHYSVFFQQGFESDARLVEQWADGVERLMKDKYGVVPDHYRMSVYLHPAPVPQADVDNAVNHCCKKASDSLSTGTIDMLAPSSPAMTSASAISSLGMRKSLPDYSAKIFASEYIPIGHYEAQRSRAEAGWQYYQAPNWFVQGLQEFDAIFHSTPFNRDSTSRRLAAWAVAHRSVFSCCTPNLAITDDYNGGATFVAFLAKQFGEPIHARLLKSSAPTFFDALRMETAERPEELFASFQRWLDRGAPMP